MTLADRRSLKAPQMANYSSAIARAIEWLGDRYLLAKPINAAADRAAGAGVAHFAATNLQNRRQPAARLGVNRTIAASERYCISSWKRLTALQHYDDRKGEPQSAQRKGMPLIHSSTDHRRDRQVVELTPTTISPNPTSGEAAAGASQPGMLLTKCWLQ